MYWVSFVVSQFGITYHFVINYYKLSRICNAFPFKFEIKFDELSHLLDDMLRTLVSEW